MAINHRSMLATMVFRSLWNNLRISSWMLLTLAMCAALVALFTTVTADARAKTTAVLRRFGANAVAYPAAGGTSDWMEFARAAQGQRVQFVRLTVGVGLVNGSPIAVVAADPQPLQELTPYWAVRGRRPRAPGECLVGRHAAEGLGVKLGQRMNVEWPDGSGTTSLAVAGIVESGDDDDERVFLVAPGGPADFSYALLSVAGGEAGLGRMRNALAAKSSHIEVKALRQIVGGEARVVRTIRVLCLSALGVVLALTALGVSASMLARVVERQKEFALLQALGAPRRSVVKFLLAESATMGCLASVAGFVLGTLLAAVVMQHAFRVSVSPRLSAFAAACAVTIAVAVLSGALACRRLLRLPLAATLQGE